MDELVTRNEVESMRLTMDRLLTEHNHNVDQSSPYSQGPTELTEYLYLGDYTDADSLGLLSGLGITHVLNCAGSATTNYSSPYFGDTSVVSYLELDAEDTANYDLSKHFSDALDYIQKAKDSGGKVLVHCRKGVNRSAAIAIAYLMIEHKKTIWDTVRMVKDLRGKILTNKNFRLQLILYAREMGFCNCDVQ